MSNRIVITTDYLRPGDTVDTMLRDCGLDPVYSPATGARTDEERLALFGDAVGAIAASEPVTREMLAAAPTLKVIARAGVGYDNVDIDAAADLGIRVCNTPGVNHHAVAEMALTLMLACARRLNTVLSGVAAGGWPREAGTELRGTTLGVIGYGPSGRAIAALGAALGMRVLVSTAHPDADSAQSSGIEFADFDTTIGSADYLTLHSRASQNDPVIGAQAFTAMKNSAVLINTARGSLVDEEALVSALTSGAIAGAGLDVLRQEPIVADNPRWTTSSSPPTSPGRPSRRENVQGSPRHKLSSTFSMERCPRAQWSEPPHAADTALRRCLDGRRRPYTPLVGITSAVIGLGHVQFSA